MAINYNPPSFRQPGQYGISLDGIFDAYLQQKAAREQSDLRGLELREKFGVDPRGMTPEQLDRGFAGPQPGVPSSAMTPRGAGSPGEFASDPTQPQFDSDPHVAAIQKYIERRRSVGSTDVRLKNAQAERLEAGAENIRRPQPVAQSGPMGPDVPQGGKILPAAQVLALNEGKSVARMLPEVESALQQAEGIMGPIGGRVGSANPYDTKAQTLDARFRTASQAFGKFMEGGVLRKEDEEKYRKMFPQLSDTPNVARNKLSIVRRQLAQKYEDDRTTMGRSGYDVTGFEALNIPKSIFDRAQPEARFEQLIAEGLDEDAAYRKLAEEGY